MSLDAGLSSVARQTCKADHLVGGIAAITKQGENNSLQPKP